MGREQVFLSVPPQAVHFRQEREYFQGIVLSRPVPAEPAFQDKD